MKTYKFGIMGLALAALVSASSCSDVLEEQPRSSFDPSFFTTEKGVEGGLTALYYHLRLTGGFMYYYCITETGTDEYTYAQAADNHWKDAAMSGAGSLTPSSCRSDNLWGSSYTYINTASGVIENGEASGIDASLLAEAHFFRAWDYFNLVQTFGGVPLDLGGGILKFNSSPKRTSERNTVPEVYTLCIFPDLKNAVDNLPENPRITGAVTKNVARFYLAKAYLTYGWWLENPNNIATYPTCDRTDPDGHNAAWYYQQAYDVAMAAINNPGPYKLMDTYRQVHLGSNDRNAECMLYADHTETEAYNSGNLGYAGGGDPGNNCAAWAAQWNYCSGFVLAEGASGAWFQPITRAAWQNLGRPWTRQAPTQEALRKFTDTEHDSRWDGTFCLAYPTNFRNGGSSKEAYVKGANGSQIDNGETFLRFLSADETAATTINYKADNIGGGNTAGESPDYKEFVYGIDAVSRLRYPGLWKCGTYRTDNGTNKDAITGADLEGYGSPNGASSRPWVLAKFSELYLIAAEAAVKGASGSMSARDLVNVLRARAGKWNGSVNYGDKQADYSAEMVAATPATITIDYILDERLREFFGEGLRWFDLVRTQTWEKYAGSYTIAGAGTSDYTPATIKRTIPSNFYLRPIPQGQIDGMESSEAEKAAYQNPGY